MSALKAMIEHLLVTILNAGRRMSYTVPSFPVITTMLCEVKYQLVNVDQIYDSYIQDCPDFTLKHSPLMLIVVLERRVTMKNKCSFFGNGSAAPEDHNHFDSGEVLMKGVAVILKVVKTQIQIVMILTPL